MIFQKQIFGGRAKRLKMKGRPKTSYAKDFSTLMDTDHFEGFTLESGFFISIGLF